MQHGIDVGRFGRVAPGSPFSVTDQQRDQDDREPDRNEARHDADGTPTDHPTGEGQARENAEQELPG